MAESVLVEIVVFVMDEGATEVVTETVVVDGAGITSDLHMTSKNSKYIASSKLGTEEKFNHHNCKSPSRAKLLTEPILQNPFCS